MSEWWTYRPSDFLMFSGRTWHRLFEQMNADLWPAPLLLAAVPLLLLLLAWRHPRAAASGLAAAWALVAWQFHALRFAEVNTAAPWFAAGFALQALLLALWRPQAPARSPWAAALLALALAWPLAGLMVQHPLSQAQVFGLAPEPTLLVTLAAFLRWRPVPWWLWPLPLAWGVMSALTLGLLDETAAALAIAGATALAAAAAVTASRSRPLPR